GGQRRGLRESSAVCVPHARPFRPVHFVWPNLLAWNACRRNAETNRHLVLTYNFSFMSPQSGAALVETSTRHRSTEIIILLGALTAFAPVSIDMYLPALPTIGVEFGAAPGHVQLSLASFFLGLASGQAFYGPISDRFGRKKPLYAGLILF